MPNVIIYSNATCPYCRGARALMNKKGVAYTELDVDRDPARWKEMVSRSGRHTVPQIFIDDHHVGGFDDLQDLDMDDELDALLGLE